MLSQITISGRPTKDPVLQSKDDTKYIVLDIAQTQGFGDDTHPLFFSCYFNPYLAERLLKAKVQKGTCLDITGKFDSKEFMHKDGTHDRSLEIRVHDWDFAIANKEQTAVPANATTGAQVSPVVAVGAQASYGAPAGYPPVSYPQGMPQTPANGYMPQAGAPAWQSQGTQPAPQSANGFSSVPQSYAGQLPFPA